MPRYCCLFDPSAFAKSSERESLPIQVGYEVEAPDLETLLRWLSRKGIPHSALIAVRALPENPDRVGHQLTQEPQGWEPVSLSSAPLSG
ncbi:MAG: hypothetical protein KatS3mg115_0962 [Candidatus Poribacteria bacterium]|nr:MAG: hypothetical protein KatS3mg115_0962 [Candidatus Poribacteria bacterium]